MVKMVMGPQKVIKQVEPVPNTMNAIVDETRRGSSMSTNGKTAVRYIECV